MKKNCCCTGHRPKGFPFRYGVDKIAGMATGADMDEEDVCFEELVSRLARSGYSYNAELNAFISRI